MQSWSPSGLQTVPQLRWGTHLAHFFGSGDELADVLVPYFKAGLENNERCLWVTGEGFTAEHARSALRGAVPDLDKRERRKQIEIANGGEWYARNERLRPDELVKGLVQREQDALAQGYTGLRTNGDCAWVPPDKWPDFLDYEMLVQKNAGGRRMICMCSYCADQLPHNGSHMDVMERHDMAVPGLLRPRPRGLNDITVGLNGSIRDLMDARALRAALERQKRSFELVMNASRMGTWRYTLADNICVYDENAQRLYGLTEARFLHDKAGARSKIHPDDLELMWSRVGHALKPGSDGRYEVEYRVKHPDGSWHWLSAWGLVEFEGEGAERKPVAIAGASRDLTRRKQAEDRQRLLLDELTHRVKNTLATIQGIASQTLRTARDLPSAREALELRIQAMARAHDVLTARVGTAADLTDIVSRSLEAFTPAQVEVCVTSIDVSSKHALALSLALHELATNATKYGALSRPAGRVRVEWRVQENMLHLDWEESGGPPVEAPARTGFGSRLLTAVVSHDLGGTVTLDYNVSGVKCNITAKL